MVCVVSSCKREWNGRKQHLWKKKKQRAAWITVRGHESRAQRLATAWEKRTALKRDPCAAPLQVPGAMGWGSGTEDRKVRDE